MRRASLLALSLAACSPAPPAPDAATPDSSAPDSSAPDSAAPDSAALPDSAAPDSSPLPDAAAPDSSSLPDALSPDAGCVEPASALYVSPMGADSNDGSSTRPFATINRAVSAATAGTTILVAAGTYRELVVLSRSGTPSSPITLRARCGARPVIDGAGLGRGTAAPALVRIESQSWLTV